MGTKTLITTAIKIHSLQPSNLSDTLNDPDGRLFQAILLTILDNTACKILFKNIFYSLILSFLYLVFLFVKKQQGSVFVLPNFM